MMKVAQSRDPPTCEVNTRVVKSTSRNIPEAVSVVFPWFEGVAVPSKSMGLEAVGPGQNPDRLRLDLHLDLDRRLAQGPA